MYNGHIDKHDLVKNGKLKMTLDKYSRLRSKKNSCQTKA